MCKVKVYRCSLTVVRVELLRCCIQARKGLRHLPLESYARFHALLG